MVLIPPALYPPAAAAALSAPASAKLGTNPPAPPGRPRPKAPFPEYTPPLDPTFVPFAISPVVMALA